MNLILYSGPQCCLCEQALEFIHSLNRDDLHITIKNVRDCPELYHLYGARIPVLRREASGEELAWPFSAQELSSFLA